MYTEQLTQELGIVGYIAPIGTGTSEVLTAAIDLSKYKRYAAVLMGGVLGASASVALAVKGSATSGGSYAAITALNVTLVKATDDGLMQVVEFSAEQVQALGLGYAFVKVSVTPSVASQYSLIVLGSDAHNGPGSAGNLAAVKAITVL